MRMSVLAGRGPPKLPVSAKSSYRWPKLGLPLRCELAPATTRHKLFSPLCPRDDSQATDSFLIQRHASPSVTNVSVTRFSRVAEAPGARFGGLGQGEIDFSWRTPLGRRLSDPTSSMVSRPTVRMACHPGGSRSNTAMTASARGVAAAQYSV
jgi:hypothetical protein